MVFVYDRITYLNVNMICQLQLVLV